MVCGDFSTTKFEIERRNNNGITRAMKKYSDIIEDLELIDHPLL